MSITAQEARACGAIAKQMRALFSGIDRLPECFDEVETLEARVATAKKEQLAVDADCARVRAAYTKLDQDYQGLQRRYAQLDEEYRVKKEQLEDTLSTLQAEVSATEKLKRNTEAELSRITRDWHLKTGQAVA